MASHYWTIEHTADVGLAARADTLAELYGALADGLVALVCEPKGVREVQSRRLSVVSDGEADMAVDFLSQLLILTQVEHFCVRRVTLLSASGERVEAEAIGEPYDPARHELGPEVKAVTYHMLDVHQSDGQWHARILLDL